MSSERIYDIIFEILAHILQKKATGFDRDNFVRGENIHNSRNQILRAIRHDMIEKNLLIPIVIDIGSGVCKAGLAGNLEPNILVNTIVGHPKQSSLFKNVNQQDFFIGPDLHRKRAVLNTVYPVERSVITHWDEIDKLINYMLKEMNVDSNEHPVLLSEPALVVKSDRDKLTQRMFEVFDVPALHFSPQPALSLYTSGRTTGLVVDAGDGGVNVAPIYDGYTLKHAIGKLNIGGKDLTNYLLRLLTERGHRFSSFTEFELVRDMKEQLSYISQDFENDMKCHSDDESISKQYSLPDGQIMSLGNERFRCMEPIFKPNLIGLDNQGLHEIVKNCVAKCDVDTRKALYANVLLAGGCTMSCGFDTRLSNELERLAPAKCKVKVVAPGERQNSVWMGGSILSSISSFRNMWVTKQEYEEHGYEIVHKKCC